MALHKKKDREVVQDMSVVDLILIDHRFIKECLMVFLDDNAEKRKKLPLAREFLDALQKHSRAEKKAIYGPCESNPELHFHILEAQIEHGIIDQKVKVIRPRLARVRVLKDEVEAELKVLAELVKNHLVEEETEILPKMKESIPDEVLFEMGREFMRLRKMRADALGPSQLLESELIQWKDSVQRLSSQFLSRMDGYVENLKH